MIETISKSVYNICITAPRIVTPFDSTPSLGLAVIFCLWVFFAFVFNYFRFNLHVYSSICRSAPDICTVVLISWCHAYSRWLHLFALLNIGYWGSCAIIFVALMLFTFFTENSCVRGGGGEIISMSRIFWFFFFCDIKMKDLSTPFGTDSTSIATALVVSSAAVYPTTICYWATRLATRKPSSNRALPCYQWLVTFPWWSFRLPCNTAGPRCSAENGGQDQFVLTLNYLMRNQCL